MNAIYEQATEKIKEQGYDWVTHSAGRYSTQEMTDAGKWQQTPSKEARVFERSERVDVSKLNEGQRRAYDAVIEHARRWAQQVTQPLRVMICGTAGAGKTFLIRSIQQEWGMLAWC